MIILNVKDVSWNIDLLIFELYYLNETTVTKLLTLKLVGDKWLIIYTFTSTVSIYIPILIESFSHFKKNLLVEWLAC